MSRRPMIVVGEFTDPLCGGAHVFSYEITAAGQAAALRPARRALTRAGVTGWGLMTIENPTHDAAHYEAEEAPHALRVTLTDLQPCRAAQQHDDAHVES
jgi:hypothetical protein